MRYTLIFILLIPIVPLSAWEKEVINYDKQSEMTRSQNWSFAQSGDGLIYVASNKGLLEFDGQEWFLFSANGKAVRSLVIVEERIYVSGLYEFGYFEKNRLGDAVYHSYTDDYPINTDEYIEKVLQINEYVYFVFNKKIMIFRNDKLVNSIKTDQLIYYSSVDQDKLYICTPTGVYYLEHNINLRFYIPYRYNKETKIVGMINYNNFGIIVTSLSGIYIVQDGYARKYNSVADDFVSKNQIFCATIKGSKVALGSVQDGVFIFDIEDKTYKEHFNMDNYLQNNTVLGCLFDNDNNLWLGLNRGIDYINTSEFIQPLFSANSVIGAGYCSRLYNNQLYLGTNQALYKMDENFKISIINQSEGQIWTMNEIDDCLFGVGDNGIIVVLPTGLPYKISIRGAYCVRPIPDRKDKILVGTYNGFCIIEKKSGIWSYANQVEGISGVMGGLVVGEGSNIYWRATNNNRIQKLRLNNELTDIEILKEYSLGEIDLNYLNCLKIIDNDLVVMTSNGLFKYVSLTDSFIRYYELEEALNENKNYEELYEDRNGNIWYTANSNTGLLLKNNENDNNTLYTIGLFGRLNEDFSSINSIDSVTTILAADKGFIKINMDQRVPEKKLSAYIKKLVINNNRQTEIITETGDDIKIPYSANSVTFMYSTIDFSHQYNIQYVYRLKGLDKEWSTPTNSRTKEYTQLREGNYIFEVRTIIPGVVDDENDIASISFTVLSPWYRTKVAKIIYVLLSLTLIYFLYVITLKKKARIIKEKEKQIEYERLLHIEDDKKKNDEINKLEKENLSLQLKYKTQELTGQALNVMRKNEVLKSIKKDIKSVIDGNDRNKGHQLSLLIKKIDHNILNDIDYEFFESNFNLIHEDLLIKLSNLYPNLTKNDKILCAYIRMSLTTKEIAPLLNITIRGVENSRYRLRKKMNLDRDTDLYNFLFSI